MMPDKLVLDVTRIWIERYVGREWVRDEKPYAECGLPSEASRVYACLTALAGYATEYIVANRWIAQEHSDAAK